jgi:AraC family transcriptional regulator
MNKQIHQDNIGNAVRLSEFNTFSGVTKFSNLSAKFVMKGQESYTLNNKTFVVNSGEYIIGNNNNLTEVSIAENAVGLCIDVSNQIITEIVSYNFENADFQEFLFTDKFLINKYNSKNTTLGYKLNELSKNLLHTKQDSLLGSELFYSVGESIVFDQTIIFEQISKLNYKKQHVTEDIFRQLLLAKNYIDDCYLNEINLEQMIEIVFISKFAFIRLFKQTFGVTPYHYLLQKRLDHATSLLKIGVPVFEVAQQTRFADTPSFSKAFKLCFGFPPTKIEK